METSERPRISILQLLLFFHSVSLFLLCYRYHLEKSNKSHSKFYSWCVFFPPLSCFSLVKPCHLFSPLDAFLVGGSRIFGPGHLPPAATPTASVPTYPAGWRCTAGWQSKPLYWDPQRTGRPRLGTYASCRGAGMGTPGGSECWFRSGTAPRRPRPQWVTRIAPGWGDWNVAAWQWCWQCCLQ